MQFIYLQNLLWPVSGNVTFSYSFSHQVTDYFLALRSARALPASVQVPGII
jgi:hypothetical protein